MMLIPIVLSTTKQEYFMVYSEQQWIGMNCVISVTSPYPLYGTAYLSSSQPKWAMTYVSYCLNLQHYVQYPRYIYVTFVTAHLYLEPILLQRTYYLSDHLSAEH